MMLQSVTTHRGHPWTPLRYPGGKNRLFGFLRRTIEAGGWRNRTYSEPFAGGAGAAIALLLQNVVDSIAINDLDPAIYAFWKTVVDHNDELVRRVRRADLTIDEWKLQREVYRLGEAADLVDLGFATFYLNRTNRSGVLTGGVIGGLAQRGTDLIDARFNREALADRIAAIGARRGDIRVTRMDGVEFFTQIDTSASFIYADPPYVVKGGSLYLNHFNAAQHDALALALNERAEEVWLVTYDDVPEVRTRYSTRFMGDFELPYSAHTVSAGRELMVASEPVASVIRSFEEEAHFVP